MYRQRSVTATGRILQRAAGRPLARPSRQAFLDAGRRAMHAAGHHPLIHRSAPGDVFNLDLHIAVVADLRTHLERRRLSLVDWTLSGHSWVMGRSREPVAVVNERTWFSFGPRMARRFRRVYGAYLRSFRGFAATYPPGFSLLYEGLGKPTLAIAATRYEWPFTHQARGWDWLDDALCDGVADGWLTLVANNRADADYIESYTGLKPAHIPSACTYPELAYTGTRPTVVICTGEELAYQIADRIQHDAIPLRRRLATRYSQEELYEHKALVVLPYNISTMALFEHYTACVPLYVPNRAFLKTLMRDHPSEVLSSISFSQVTGRSAAPRPGRIDLNDIRDESIVDWYLDRADFYDAEWMPHVRQFESWEHLDELLATDDPHAISAQMADEKPDRLGRIAKLWDALGWFEQL